MKQFPGARLGALLIHLVRHEKVEHMVTSNFHPSVIGSIPAGQGHICEQFLGDGQQHAYLKHALPYGELLLVEYPFDGSNQSAARPAASNPQAEP